MTKTLLHKTHSKEDIESAREQLLKYFKEDPTVYTRLLSVSRSGMHRVISLHIAREHEILSLTYLAGLVLGKDLKDVDGTWGIPANGCGMDMGFHIVNNLSMQLYCPKDYDHDSAYTLKHRWL